VLNVNNLTQVTLISNIGTFLLYGMTCIVCIIAFAGVAGRGVFTTVIAPILGATLNILMLVGVIYYAITSGGASQTNTIVAGIFSIAWLIIGFGYLYMRKVVAGIPILHSEDHKEKIKASVDDAVATD
jgi:APA family basic amino acid/polyamine antiporter